MDAMCLPTSTSFCHLPELSHEPALGAVGDDVVPFPLDTPAWEAGQTCFSTNECTQLLRSLRGLLPLALGVTDDCIKDSINHYY